MQAADVSILGSGIVSRCMALLLSQQALRVALQARPAAPTGSGPDVRAYALNAASVRLLQTLKVWEALPQDARTAVHTMRVRGDDDRREALTFSAAQQGAGELAWIVDTAALETVLETAVGFAPRVDRCPSPPDAPLRIVAEGKASVLRDQLGVVFNHHPYGHSAVAARLTTQVPHAHTAHQWFRSPDVLALLPLDRPVSGQSWALVWSQPEALAREALTCDAAAFEASVRAATGGALGEFHLAGERSIWPLALGQAQDVVGPGWALVGDAAHVVHPLAGQGLNLGLSDVRVLASVLAEREAWRPLGDEVLLRRYARRRFLPTWAMAGTTDGLWQLFSAEQAPLRELRNCGLDLVNRLAPIKRWLTARALEA